MDVSQKYAKFQLLLLISAGDAGIKQEMHSITSG